MEWNIPTIIGTLIIVAILFAIAFTHFKNKKQGKSSCGCGCENCAMKGSCHPNETTPSKH